jgi:hypothetical protein
MEQTEFLNVKNCSVAMPKNNYKKYIIEPGVTNV